jgi:hypothetical protein
MRPRNGALTPQINLRFVAVRPQTANRIAGPRSGRMERSMESPAVALARQAIAIACASALLVGAIYSGMSPASRPTAARQNVDLPIQVHSVVLESSAPAAVVAAAQQARRLPPSACPHGNCARSSLAKTQPPPRQTVERTAAPIILASAAPAPEPQRDTSFPKRLFAPVGAFRDSVARMIRWP